MTYRLAVARTAARALAKRLPEAVSAAALELVNGPLLENPYRVGKRLQPPLHDKWSARRGQYRIIYTIDERRSIVTVLQVAHRDTAYRPL